MWDLAVNLLASVIAAGAAWSAQKALRYRRLAARRRFFGLTPRGSALLVVAKHASSPREESVHSSDVAALVELAALLKSCDVEPRLQRHAEAVGGLGEVTEFCIGGPAANARTAAHLRWLLPGVVQDSGAGGHPLTLHVGAHEYRRVPGFYEYVLVARVFGVAAKRPLFLLCGQTARTNAAAARYLVERHRELSRRYGDSARFCFVLRIVDPAAYGNNVVEFVADVTDAAFTAPTPGPTTPVTTAPSDAAVTAPPDAVTPTTSDAAATATSDDAPDRAGARPPTRSPAQEDEVAPG